MAVGSWPNNNCITAPEETRGFFVQGAFSKQQLAISQTSNSNQQLALSNQQNPKPQNQKPYRGSRGTTRMGENGFLLLALGRWLKATEKIKKQMTKTKTKSQEPRAKSLVANQYWSGRGSILDRSRDS